MALITKLPRGTKDILPGESEKWQYIEEKISAVCRAFGYGEIRVPTFEHTELFERGVGDTTDVVQKEMYTFTDKGGRSVTLRPEGTASVTRAVLENGLYGGALPIKLHYFVNCFRYEKPQAGRLREFHQFGVELFGASDPSADAEVILLADAVFRALGVRQLKLKLNSIGCPTCRKAYTDALRTYFAQYKDQLCETCLGRLERNPMRILDCKSPVCKEIAEGAPRIIDYLCEDCAEHFEGVKRRLEAAGRDFEIDPTIVRGLDYYTRTVFEFVSDAIGAQGTVCGGGRYDGLAEELGGAPLAGLGFAMGMERLLLTMEAEGIALPGQTGPALYIASIGADASVAALSLATRLRAAGVSVESDIVGRGLKAQMKYADKRGARFSVVLGDDEIANGRARFKNMESGEQTELALDDTDAVCALLRG